MTIVLEQKKRKQAPRREGYLWLDGISWESYEKLLQALGERHLRVTYDQGDLEIMTLSPEHEELARLLDLLVFALADELSATIKGRRSMTFKRADLKRGLEPDDCYWIQHEKEVRNIRHYDPEKHPQPDLVLEVDVTSSSLNRMKTYEIMGVAEVWRWTEDTLEVQTLNKKGKLTKRTVSSVFPGFKPTDLLAFLENVYTDGEIEMVRHFRRWVREQIAAGSLKSMTK